MPGQPKLSACILRAKIECISYLLMWHQKGGITVENLKMLFKRTIGWGTKEGANQFDRW